MYCKEDRTVKEDLHIEKHSGKNVALDNWSLNFTQVIMNDNIVIPQNLVLANCALLLEIFLYKRRGPPIACLSNTLRRLIKRDVDRGEFLKMNTRAVTKISVMTLNSLSSQWNLSSYY